MRRSVGRLHSAGETAVAQKLDLLNCACTVEERIAMRKTSEAPNDVAMTDRVRFVVFAKSAIESHRHILRSGIFGVGERQIKEQCEPIADSMIEAGGDRLMRHVQRQGVSRVHAGRVPERVARKLIEQNEKCERAVRSRPPVVQFAARGSFIQGNEACAELPVERGILREQRHGPASRQNRMTVCGASCSRAPRLFPFSAIVLMPAPCVGVRHRRAACDDPLAQY